jgi:hypothetical protein
MPMMITDGQRSYIKELLVKAEASITEYTSNKLEDLDCREAANIIADLKSKLYRKRLQRTLCRRQQRY